MVRIHLLKDLGMTQKVYIQRITAVNLRSHIQGEASPCLASVDLVKQVPVELRTAYASARVSTAGYAAPQPRDDLICSKPTIVRRSPVPATTAHVKSLHQCNGSFARCLNGARSPPQGTAVIYQLAQNSTTRMASRSGPTCCNAGVQQRRHRDKTCVWCKTPRRLEPRPQSFSSPCPAPTAAIIRYRRLSRAAALSVQRLLR